MSYKVVICDDDELILMGLSKMIPWKELELDVVGTGTNGREAMKLVDEYRPDIIISDIRMPFVDGLELIQYIKEKNKDTIVIFVSGYDDFSYAQQAIKQGAMDYILKPIDENILIERLKAAVNECKSMEKSKNINQEHQQYLTEKTLQSLIFESNSSLLEEVGEEQYRILKGKYCNVVLVELDGYEQLLMKMTKVEVERIHNFLIRSCRNQLSNDIGLVSYDKGKVGVYFVSDSKKTLRESREGFIDTIKKQFDNFFPEGTVSFACGTIYQGVERLRESYQEAKIAENEKFLHAKGVVVYYDELGKKEDNDIKGIESVLAEIDFISLIKQGDMDKIQVRLGKLKDLLLGIGGKSYMYMTMVVANLYMSLIKELKQLGIEEDGFSLDLLNDYQLVSKSMSIDSVIEDLEKSLSLIIEYMNQNKNRYSKVVAKARQYMDNHMEDHNLSIEEVADAVHMSSSYFSMIFRKEVGQSFTDELIYRRIEMAKELMSSTDLKIYEISDKVGYDTAAYFSTAFKKSTGMSPSEYKKKM